MTGEEDQPLSIQLQAIDAENNPSFFDASKPNSESAFYTLNVNGDSGLVTVTPPFNFVGSFNVQVGVRGLTQTNTMTN